MEFPRGHRDLGQPTDQRAGWSASAKQLQGLVCKPRRQDAEQRLSGRGAGTTTTKQGADRGRGQVRQIAGAEQGEAICDLQRRRHTEQGMAAQLRRLSEDREAQGGQGRLVANQVDGRAATGGQGQRGAAGEGSAPNSQQRLVAAHSLRAAASKDAARYHG